MAIDVDPRILATAAAASAHAYEQAIVHVGEEIKARDVTNLDHLVDSLAADGPYAYTIMPMVNDGKVTLPVLSDKEEIREAYAFIRGLSDLHEVVGLTEVRGAWYLFQDAAAYGSLSGSPEVHPPRGTLAIFPSGAQTGITGELVWAQVPRSVLGAEDEVDIASDDVMATRLQLIKQHARFLDGLRANDVDAVLDTIHDGAASAIRDYVAATGGLVSLSGADAHRAWFSSFFEKFEVRSADALVQVTEDWYVFAELRLVVVDRASGGGLAFNTAEFFVPSKNGRFIARIGHGTEPTPVR